jgi:hypothetical protein
VFFQSKSAFVTGNARRASLSAAIFSPLLVLVSGALRNQQADNLLPAFFSTDALGWFYWDQSRYGSIHSFLAFPIQNIRLNLIFQLHLRAASLIFLVCWIVESCVRSDSENRKSHVQRLFAFIFLVVFLLTYQEAGDALIYGANAHPIAIPFAILALSVNFQKSHKASNYLRSIALLVWVIALWGIAIWTSIFTALWAPALVLLQLAYISKYEKVFKIGYAVWLVFQVFVVTTCSWVFSQIAKNGGENTSFVRGKFISEALKRSYVSVPLLLFFVFAVCATALVIFRGQNWSNVFSLLSTVFFVGSVPVIAASTHVQQYSYMPRYFGVQYISALLILVVLLSGSIRATRLEALIRSVDSRRRLLAIVALISFMLTVTVTALSDVGFGTGKVDASGFVNTGQGLTKEMDNSISGYLDGDPMFVAGSYWYVWPLVFEYRSQSREVIAITKKATPQSNFPKLYSAKVVAGLCVGESIRCWSSTIHAQLNGQQLHYEIDVNVIGYLSDGTPIREMWVSKYPIRRLER